MTALAQRASADRPAPAVAVQPDFRAGVEIPVVTARPATPGAVVLAVRGEVDSCTSSLLRDLFLENLRPGCPQLVADLTEVSFFGAAGLTALIAARNAAEAAGIKLRLVADTRVVLRPLTITGLDDLFDICPDIANARMNLGDIAVEIIDGSLDNADLQTEPRAGPDAPCQA